MKFNHKFSFVKLVVCKQTLLLHRQVFDKQYVQTCKIGWKDRPILIYFSLMCKIYPDYRSYLKKWKAVLIRAYNQKRISLFQIIAFWQIRKINTERYSSY